MPDTPPTPDDQIVATDAPKGGGATETPASDAATGAEAAGDKGAPARDASDKPAPKEGEKSEDGAEGGAGKSDDDDPEPDGDDREAWRAWRDRESNRMALRAQEAEDRAALGLQVPDATPAAGAATPPADASASATAGEAQDIVARFEAIRAEIADAQANHDWGDPTAEKGYTPTPGEAKLEAFVGELVPEFAATQARLAEIETFYSVQMSRSILGYAQDAAARFKEEYGTAIAPPALIGMAQNGGLRAWAALKGVPEAQAVLYVTPDVLLEIAAAKLGPKLRKPGAAPAKAEGKAALPPVARGGGATPERDGPMTDDEILDRAHARARAGKGAR